jgi:hypothetical protein
MAQLQKGTDYTTGDQVTADNLDALVDNAILLPGAITDQIAAGSVSGSDTVLINQVGALKKATALQIASTLDLSPYLLKSGGTMAGSLVLYGSPSLALEAATKGYVDTQYNSVSSAIIAGLALCVAKAGDTMTGPLTLPGNPASALQAAPKQYVDNSFLAGSVVKSAYSETTAYATYNTVIPFDDTVPQITEGTEILTVAITPTSASSKIRIKANLYTSTISGGGTVVFAIFRDSNANAIFVTSDYKEISLETSSVSFEFYDAPSSVSTVTYKLRVGPGNASFPLALNGTNSRRFGGAARCTLIAEEIK